MTVIFLLHYITIFFCHKATTAFKAGLSEWQQYRSVNVWETCCF